MTALQTIVPCPGALSQAAQPGQQTATILRPVAGGMLIAHHGLEVLAQTALSCLVQPEPGDHVLIASADAIWIIAVLSRASGAPLRLLGGTDAIIGGPDAALTLAPGTFNLHTPRANLFIEEVMHAGGSITAHLKSIKLFAGLVETLAERALLQFRNLFRIVEETDHLRAQTIDHTATGSLHLQAQNAFVMAENALRMDAEQIHMG
jgi:hypothetical protein